MRVSYLTSLISPLSFSSSDVWLGFPPGGYGASKGHDGHILTTLSAIQIMLMQDAAHLLDVERLTSCAQSTYTGPGSIVASDTSHTVLKLS